MEGKSRVVPVSSSAQNVLSVALGFRRDEAWSEKEPESPRSAGSATSPEDAVKTPPGEDPSEPFLRKDSESESSVESERLCCPPVPKPKIYSIDLEKGLSDKRTSASEISSHRKSNKSNNKNGIGGGGGNNRKSQCDAKVVDKFVRNNRKRRKRKDAKAVLIKLCQCCPWTVPWSLLVVSAIQICTYVFNNDSFYRWLIFTPVRQYEIWRFVTYTFLHAGSVHLMLNVIIQILVAFPLETEQGHGTVLLLYFAGVLAGGLGASVFEPTMMVGASAGVYCLLMSHIPHIVMNFQSLSHRYFRIVAVLVLCISDVIYSIRHCLTKGNLQPRIGVAAHVSGAICGLMFGFIVYQGCSKLSCLRVARYAGLIVYLGWIVLTVAYNLKKTV